VQLGSQEQLRRLPRTRLEELLERYRDCLDQAASLYQGESHPERRQHADAVPQPKTAATTT
jgi:hypothetical protein